MLPAQIPHQHQAVLAPREEVAAVPCEPQAGDILVVAVQDDQEIPCGDLGIGGHTRSGQEMKLRAWTPSCQVTEEYKPALSTAPGFGTPKEPPPCRVRGCVTVVLKKGVSE